MGVVKFCSKCIIGFVVLVLFLLYVPGIPPYVTFSAFEVDPAYPREGPLAKNNILDNAEQMFKGQLIGPESIASRAKNEIFVGLQNGNIVRILGQDFEKSQVIASVGPGKCVGPWEEHICGRPLGLRFTKEKKLLIADAYLGLFELDFKTGKRELLVDPKVPIEGIKPHLIDDLDADDDGNIYWSDGSAYAQLKDSLVEFASDPSGRLIKYNAQTKKCEVMLSELHFANGVQLSPNQTFVLVSETFKHRVIRYWLKGPKTGSRDVFVSGLPGMPDNVRARKEGGYYVSLIRPRHPDYTDFYELTSKMPGIRKVVVRAIVLLQKVLDLINHYLPNHFCANFSFKLLNLGMLTKWMYTGEAIIVEVDEDGKIVGSLQGSKGVLRMVSEAQQFGDYIFFASPWSDFLGRLHIDKVRKTTSDDFSIPEKPTSTTKAKKEEL